MWHRARGKIVVNTDAIIYGCSRDGFNVQYSLLTINIPCHIRTQWYEKHRPGLINDVMRYHINNGIIQYLGECTINYIPTMFNLTKYSWRKGHWGTYYYLMHQ